MGDIARLADGPPSPDSSVSADADRQGDGPAYPELDPEDVLTPRGMELLNTLHEEGCQDFPDLDAVTTADAQKVNLMSVDSWATRFRASDRPAGAVPRLLHHGVRRQRPRRQRPLLMAQLCHDADHVLFHVFTGTDHDSAVGRGLRSYAPWLMDRLTSDEPVDGCQF